MCGRGSLLHRTVFALLVLGSLPLFAGDAAELSLADLRGEIHNLQEHRGKIVILNFWATWCVPCREEMPLLVSIQNRYADQGVVVIGASADEASTQNRIPEFLQKLKITFPVWVGANTRDMEKLGLGTGMPATAVIDQEGRIVGRILGIVEKKDLTYRIEYLLGNRAGRAPPPLVDQISKAQKQTDPHHQHEGEEKHSHGGVAMEGASTVPS
jgi:thiol-disulfide isomerase/thioredoxin